MLAQSRELRRLVPETSLQNLEEIVESCMA